jgi:hypothetical protein
MITIRNGLFETNSSSCHCYVYFPKTDTANIPSTVELIPDNKDTPLQRMFNDYYEWFGYDEVCVERFLARLYKMGIKTIKCSDKDVETLAKRIKKDGCETYLRFTDTEALSLALFGSKSQMITLEDEIDMRGYIKKQYGEDAEFLSIRLS